MPLDSTDLRNIFEQVANKETGYGQQEAAAWARGVVDALTICAPVLVEGPLALDRAGVGLLAGRLVRL